MRLVLLAALLTGCRDQEAVCRTAVEDLPSPDSWIEACVRERWTDRQIQCHLRAQPGTFLGLFCDQE